MNIKRYLPRIVVALLSVNAILAPFFFSVTTASWTQDLPVVVTGKVGSVAPAPSLACTNKQGEKSSSVPLKWQAPATEGVTGYQFLWASSGGTGVDPQVFANTATRGAFGISSLASGTYTVALRTFYGSWNADSSATVTIKVTGTRNSQNRSWTCA